MATPSLSPIVTADRVDLQPLLRALYGEPPAVAPERPYPLPGLGLAPSWQGLAQDAGAARDRIAQSWWQMQTYGDTGDGDTTLASRQTLPERLAALLIEQSDGRGLLAGISHAALADYLGTYRENVSAILRAFRRQGLVELGHRRVQILDFPALAEIADM